MSAAEINLTTRFSWLSDARAVPVFVVCYFAVQAALVSSLSNAGGLDDGEQLSYIGTFEWGYGGSQPPLYTWLAGIVASVVGPNLVALQLVKFGLLAGAFISVFFAGRMLGFPQSVFVTGALGLFLLPQIGWESQRALSHSVASIAGCALTLLAFAWLAKTRSLLAAAAFGLAMAAALLGKYNSAVFVAALLLSAASVPRYRSVLRWPTLLVSGLVLCVAILPTALWMLDHAASVTARTRKFALEVGQDQMFGWLLGPASLLRAVFLFALCLLCVSAVAWWLSREDPAAPALPKGDFERLIERTVLFGLLIVLVLVVLSGATAMKDRWLTPVLFLLPLVVSARFHRLWPLSGVKSRLVVASVVAALLFMPALAVAVTYGRPVKAPIAQLDYRQLFETVRIAEDFKTVASNSSWLAGNFRLLDPSLQAVHIETPDAGPRIKRPVLAVWQGSRGPNTALVSLLAEAKLSIDPSQIRRFEMRYLTRDDKTLPVSYAVLP